MIFFRFEQCVAKFSLLSKVIPRSLKMLTVCTKLPLISISVGYLTLLLVINMKYVFDQFRSSLLNLHHS
jgi:hypothetical protein